MVPVKTYKALWEAVATSVGTIQRVLVLSDEGELDKYMRELANGEVVLVASIPVSDSEAPDLDNYEEGDQCFLFILKKANPADLTDSELLDLRHDTQVILTAVKREMLRLAGDFDSGSAQAAIMHRLQLNGIHTEPEFNWLGGTGWSVSFVLKSIGLYNDGF